MKILYVMPRSTSDVMQSTAVCRRLKEKFPDSEIYFGVEEQYASSIKDCPWITKVLKYNPQMDNPDLLNFMTNFDICYTPHIYLQYLNTANFVHYPLCEKNIVEHFCWHTDLSIDKFSKDDFYIPIDETYSIPKSKYILVITATGIDNKTKIYEKWDDIIYSLKMDIPNDIKIIQAGDGKDSLIAVDGIIDFRGKTKTVAQLNKLIKNATLVLSIDSYPMHAAYVLGIPFISLFSSTSTKCSGPTYLKDSTQNFQIFEAKLSEGCKKVCYKNECMVRNNCINSIDDQEVYKTAIKFLNQEPKEYKVLYPSISGYTTIFNGEKAGLPYIESIQSVLPHVDELVIIDGESTDGTYEKLQEMFGNDEKIKIYQKPYDMSEPGIDGQQKAYSRALCTSKYCLQFDADQIFEDGEKYKLKDLVKKFPKDQVLMHFPIIDYFGTIDNIKEGKYYISDDYHMSRWALSCNMDNCTHGICKQAKLINEKTGVIYAKEFSDGCEYIDIVSEEIIPQFGPYTPDIDFLRRTNPKKYEIEINRLYKEYPHFHHLSWYSIEQKINHFITFWSTQWNLLYQTNNPNRFFPNINPEDVTKEMIQTEAKKLFKQGGCHLKENEQGILIPLHTKFPEILNSWREKVIKKWS